MVCGEVNPGRARQRCRLNIPGEKKCEGGYNDNNDGEFDHVGPLS